MNGASKGIIAIIAVVVIVMAAGVLLLNKDDEDADGFQPQPPVSGDWEYTALTASAQNDTVFYDGTLRIVVTDNVIEMYDKNTVKTLASDMSEEELDMVLNTINKHNTGGATSEGLYWPPETDPSYIIRNSFDFVDGYTHVLGHRYVTDGDERVKLCQFEKDGRTLMVATSGIIYAVTDTNGDVPMTFVLDGWEFD